MKCGTLNNAQSWNKIELVEIVIKSGNTRMQTAWNPYY